MRGLFLLMLLSTNVQAQSNCPIVTFPSPKSAALLSTPSTHRVLMKQTDGSFTAYELSNTSPYSTLHTFPHFDRQLSACVPGQSGLRSFLAAIAPTPSGGYITETYQPSGAAVSIFDAKSNLLSETVPNSEIMLFADMNGDGIMDAIGTPDFQHNATVSIALGGPGATFQMPVAYNTFLPGIQYIVPADLNGDHKLDLVVAAFGAIFVYLGNGDGTLQPAKKVFQQVNAGPPIAVADLNGDGIPDLVYGDEGTIAPTVVKVALGLGDGTFGPQTQIPSGSTGVVIGDLNGDGIPDILSGGTLLSGDGKGNFPSRRDIDLSVGLGTPIITDFDGDGIADIVFGFGNASIIAGDSVSVIFGTGKGNFAVPPLTLLPDFPPALGLGALASADLNGDGIPDLVSADDSGLIVVLKGVGDGSFQDTQHLQFTGGLPVAVVFGDFNHDGKPDFAVAGDGYDASNTGGVAIALGNGDGTFQSLIETTVPAGGMGVATGDFNGDGKLDLAFLLSQESSATADSVLILLGEGDGTLKTGTSYPVGPYAMSIVAGDFNGDGKLDLVVSDSGTFVQKGKDGNLLLLTGKGDGTFVTPAVIPSIVAPSQNPLNILAADFNGDGKLDLAVNTQVGMMILLGAGNGTFQTKALYSGSTGSVASGDLNGDGIQDLVLSGKYMLGNGDGSFKSPAPLLDGGNLFALADFNHDGKLDIAVESGPAFGIVGLLNTSPPTPAITMVSAASLVPAPIAPASIATAFGKNLSGEITIEDSAGTTSPATLFYSSPSQINFAVPAGLDAGLATVTIGSQQTTIEIAPVSPSLFTLTPGGLAAAYVTRATPFGTTYEPVFATQNGVITPVPIDLSTPAYLVLFGTGLRDANFITAFANNIQLTVSYAGPQPGTPGLDQVNVLLPTNLAGSGYSNIVLSVTNPVYIVIK